SVRRGRKLYVPHGYTVLQQGDRVTVFATHDSIPLVRQRLTGQPAGDSEPEQRRAPDREIRVCDLIRTDYDFVSELTPLSHIIELEENSSTIDYLVLDAEGNFVGMLPFQAFRSVLSQDAVYPLVIARDLLTTDMDALLPTYTLADALDKFGQHDFDCLPVIEPKNPRKPIGIVRRFDLMERYRQAHLGNQ
ncbi:MAG: CBS domain-containing protein, partial [Candidatus Poribacteria bacterium]|nr:CBS domain-containing protein [Candidatus Poribacteria bacterium]